MISVLKFRADIERLFRLGLHLKIGIQTRVAALTRVGNENQAIGSQLKRAG